MSEAKKVLVANVKMLGAAQSMVECQIDVDGANVAKILSVQSIPRIASTEVLDGEVIFEGMVFVKLFVLCQDGGVKTFSSQHKFSGKFENKAVVFSSKVFAQAKVVDSVVSSVSENGAKIVVSIETTFTQCDNVEVPTLSPEEENLEIKEKELKTWAVNSCASAEFETTGEILIPGENVKIALVENATVIKNVTTYNGYGIVKGEITSKIMYTNGDSTALLSAVVSTNFSHEIEIAGATKDGMMQATVSLLEEKFKFLLEQEHSQAKASLEFSLSLNVCEFEINNSIVVADAYSVENETKLVSTAFDQSTPLGELYIEKKIEGNVVLDDTQPRINKMLAFSGASIGAIQVTVKGGQATIVGVAYANIIFEGEDETTEEPQVFAPNSVQIEIPFEVSENYDEEATLVSFCAMIDDVDISVKKGKNVFFDAKIKAHLFMSKNTSDSCITSIAVMEPRKEKESGIEIVFAKKGTTIWDNAKKLGVATSLIVEQNPAIADPLEKDEKIVIYNRSEINFD